MTITFWRDSRVRGIFYQALLFAALAALAAFAWRNAVANMAARGIPMGFGFWNQIAGFDINQSLIDYSALSTYGTAFWVGLINTLLVAALSIVLATPLGFLVGVARLSPNFLLSRLALVYVELMRNTPLLLQLFFWYNAVLKALPGPRAVAFVLRRRVPQQSRIVPAASRLRRRRALRRAGAGGGRRGGDRLRRAGRAASRR